MKKICVGLLLSLCLVGQVFAAPINVVAAENFYGQLAKEIGGEQVRVTSIMQNPDADPHLFTTAPSTSIALYKAQIIIYNGVDYDPWMDSLLKSLPQQSCIIQVATLMQVKDGDNPHLWYKPETFPKLARKLAAEIIRINPQQAKQINLNLQHFLRDYSKVERQIAYIKQHYPATKVTATEPVFGYMAQALGFKMYGEDFQWKIMNGSEPGPRTIAAYQDLLQSKKVKLMFYNQQVISPLTTNLQRLARKNQIALVGVSETMPAKISISNWLSAALSTIILALAKGQQ